MYLFENSCPLPTNELFPGSDLRSTDQLLVETISGHVCIAQATVFVKSYMPEQSTFFVFTAMNHLGFPGKDITNIVKSYYFIN